MQIQHLRNKAIDYLLWDKRIAVSQGSLPYAQSWYLDIVSPDWEALVSENYEYIMPLPAKKKFGINYLVQPALTQQLGLFSEFDITIEIIQQFIQAIPYLSYEINLNERNPPHGHGYTNLILKLNKPFTELNTHFSKNTVRNTAKALKAGITVHYNAFNSETEEFMRANANVSYVPELNTMFRIIEEASRRQSIDILTARNTEGSIIASACFHKTNNRIVNFFPVTNDEGRLSSAMFLIILSIIEKYSGKNLLLDFEGSRIETIARFYKGFGAHNKPYFVIRKNRPDMITGILKRIRK